MSYVNEMEVDFPTLCDIYKCNECPRFMDDCDGNDSAFEEEYTVVWYDDKNNRHTEYTTDFDKAKGLADANKGHVYDESENRVYPAEETHLSYSDLRDLNKFLVDHAMDALSMG